MAIFPKTEWFKIAPSYSHNKDQQILKAFGQVSTTAALHMVNNHIMKGFSMVFLQEW